MAKSLSESSGFLAGFLSLAVVSGVTIGMSKIVTTFFALQLGASAKEIGIISGMESLGMVLVTVPAGFVIARHGARTVYFLASLGPMLVNILLPWSTAWYALAAARGAIGLCIPFRIVSMNGAFLQQLQAIGGSKAGWYRGALTLGIALLGPALGHFFVEQSGFLVCYFIIAALFALMGVYSRSFFPEQAGASADTAHSGQFLRQVRTLLAERDIAEVCAIELVSSSAMSVFSTFIILVAMELPGLSEKDGVSLILLQGATAVLGLFGLGYVFRHLTRGQAYVSGVALGILALVLLGTAETFAGLAFGAVLISAASALVHLVNMTQLSRHEADKSKISGLFNLAQMLGGVTGAFAGGVLSDYVRLQSLFLLWIGLVVALVAVGVLRPLRRGSLEGGNV